MQVSVEATTALERRVTVEVPAERIEQEIKVRLKSLASKAKLDGFRPGKVPLNVVERKFAGRVRAEVLGDMIRSSYEEAVTQEKLRPASTPRIETLYEQPDKGLGYIATFEVYPEIKLAPLTELSLEKPVVGITDQDVDHMLENLRKQRAGWEPVEREARKDDQLQVEFRTRIEGDEAHGDHAQQTSLVLGASTIENEIEDRLYGLKVGEEVVIDQRLPDDFHKAELAGRPVQYFIKLLSLYEPKLPALDEEFVRSLGVEDGTLESLRVEVRANMQRELEQAIKAKLRQQVMDTLLASNAIELPKALIDKEINSLVEQGKKAARGSAARPQDPATQQARHEATARRRVTLGLLLSDIVKTNEIKPDAARVRALVDTLASSYEDPAEVVKWYYGSSERLAQMESLALEEQVVDYVLERARVKNTDSTFDALMNPKQSEPA